MAEDQMMSARNGVDCQVVVIGGSTGSIDVLLPVLSALQPPLSFGLVIVVHRKNTFNSNLETLLALKTRVPVHEVDDKDAFEVGHVYVAPADYHLLVEHNGTFALDYSEKVHYSRPAIDVTFESAADVFGAGAVGILLSGANSDGTQGLKAIKKAGGVAVVQKPSTAQVAIMPQEAINNVPVDQVLDIPELARFINQLNRINQNTI